MQRKLQRIPSISLTEAAMGGDEGALFGSSLMHGTYAEETASMSFRDRVGIARSMPNFAYSAFLRGEPPSSTRVGDGQSQNREECEDLHHMQQQQLSTSLTAFDMLNRSGFSLEVTLNKEEVESVRSMDIKTRIEMASYADVDRFKMFPCTSGQMCEKVSQSDDDESGGEVYEDGNVNGVDDYGAEEQFDFEL